jgi:hypothetical protein
LFLFELKSVSKYLALKQPCYMEILNRSKKWKGNARPEILPLKLSASK